MPSGIIRDNSALKSYFFYFFFSVYLLLFSGAHRFATDRGSYFSHFENPESSRFEPLFGSYMTLLDSLGVNPYFSFSLTALLIGLLVMLSISNFHAQLPVREAFLFSILILGILAYYSGIAFRNGLALAVSICAVSYSERGNRSGWVLLFTAPFFHYSTSYIVGVYVLYRLTRKVGLDNRWLILSLNAFLTITLVRFLPTIVDFLFPNWVSRALFEREPTLPWGPHPLFFSFTLILVAGLFVYWLIRITKMPKNEWSTYDNLFIFAFPIVGLYLAGDMSLRPAMPLIILYFIHLSLFGNIKVYPRILADAVFVATSFFSILYFAHRLSYF